MKEFVIEGLSLSFNEPNHLKFSHRYLVRVTCERKPHPPRIPGRDNASRNKQIRKNVAMMESFTAEIKN